MKLRTLAAPALLLLAATASAEVAVYDLDAKNAKEIAAAIANVLQAQCTAGPSPNPVTNQTMCHSELLSTGQLLVEAPASSQARIAAVLQTIAARDASPTPTVTLRYWVIYGEPGKPDDAGLEPLASVLAQLERVHGELGFSVEDFSGITTQSGANGSAAGGPLQINQTVRANGDSADAAIRLSFSRPPLSQNLNVDVTIRRGEYLVIGERSTGEPDNRGRLFYVVHWPQGE